MKKIMSSVIRGISLGITIGLLFASAFSLIYHTSALMPSTPEFVSHFSSTTIATIVSILLWALMGLVFSISPMIFKVEHWSITRQTITHFIVTFGLFTPLALVAGWFPVTPSFLISFVIEFIVIYGIMWWIFMTKARREITAINVALQQQHHD